MTDHRARPWLPGLVTGLGVLVADQVTKSWAVSALDDGRIIAQGDRDTILEDPNARKHYLGEEFKM